MDGWMEKRATRHGRTRSGSSRGTPTQPSSNASRTHAQAAANLYNGRCTCTVTQAVLASRGGPTHAAWRAFYEQQAGARAARQRDLEHDLFRAWSAYLASGGK